VAAVLQHNVEGRGRRKDPERGRGVGRARAIRSRRCRDALVLRMVVRSRRDGAGWAGLVDVLDDLLGPGTVRFGRCGAVL